MNIRLTIIDIDIITKKTFESNSIYININPDVTTLQLNDFNYPIIHSAPH